MPFNQAQSIDLSPQRSRENTMNLPSRVSQLFVAMAVVWASAAAHAQSYPQRTVTLVVPFAVGSSTDIMTRLVAKGLNERLKTTHFIVDNKAGANGVIGSDYVAKAKPDGYTLLVGTGTTHTQAPWMMKQMPYDPMKDFEPIAGIGGVPLMVVVGKDSPIKSIDDLRKTVGANPGKFAYGTAFGAATVCSENLKRGLNIDLVQIPYKSSPQAITDLMGGRIAMMCTDANTAMGPIRNNQVRALAVTTSKRNAQLPDLPALVEILPNFPEMRSWVGVFAPKGTPNEVVQLLAPAILAVTESAEVLRVLTPNGFERLTASGPALSSFVQSELIKWEKLIEQAGIQRE
jgi:tripartite-type tricarboxylate transporter receptor subunit TctC